jgi:hypothetical protein
MYNIMKYDTKDQKEFGNLAALQLNAFKNNVN